MKKNFIVFAALCISMGLLSGCGNSNDLKSTESNTDTAYTTEKADSKNILENIIYTSENIKVTYLGTENNKVFGPELKLKIENLSEQNISLSIKNSSVNGIMIDAVFYADITPGKTANKSVTFLINNLADNNITEIDTFEFSFNIYNSDTLENIENTDMITINP